MAKNQANYPASLDALTTDRTAGQVVTSDSYDVIEDAITEIEAELRRVTTKTGAGTLTSSEGGLVKVSAAAPYTLFLPTAVGNTGLTYLLVKTDDNSNLITVDADGTETINGALTYTGLNSRYAYVAVKSDNANWFILFSSGLVGELNAGAHTIGFTLQTDTGTGAKTIDWKLGNKFKFTFGAGNVTFTFTAPTNPCTLMLTLIQDATGSRTVTWPATVKWAGGDAPTLSTAANARDKIALDWDGTQYDAIASLAFA